MHLLPHRPPSPRHRCPPTLAFSSLAFHANDDFYFAQSKSLSALRYAFILRKRTGAIIPKAIYNKLMAEVKAMRPQAESAPAEQESQPAAEVSDAPAAVEPSPLARPYSEMKAKHTDAILLFRTGDFYTSLGDDAKAVSEILGIILTRTQAKDITREQASFPAHNLDSYLPKLVRAGKRVAICEALQSASPQHSSSKLGSAFGSLDWCDGLPEPQPEKKSRKRSTKKAENK